MPLTKIKSSSIAANAITAINIAPGTTANILTAGNNITIEANGRISSTATGGGGTNSRTLAYNMTFGG